MPIALRQVVGIIMLVAALVLGVLGRMPQLEAVLFGLCGLGLLL